MRAILLRIGLSLAICVLLLALGKLGCGSSRHAKNVSDSNVTIVIIYSFNLHHGFIFLKLKGKKQVRKIAPNYPAKEVRGYLLFLFT